MNASGAAKSQVPDWEEGMPRVEDPGLLVRGVAQKRAHYHPGKGNAGGQEEGSSERLQRNSLRESSRREAGEEREKCLSRAKRGY